MALKRYWSITDGISVTDQVSETLAAALAGSAA
jgi:hypothetical protein